MTTRSSRLYVGAHVADGFVSVFTCPPSTVILVKSILVLSTSALKAGSLAVQAASGQVTVTLLEDSAPVQFQPVEWNGWVVLEEGDELVTVTNITTANYWISGAVLPVGST